MAGIMNKIGETLHMGGGKKEEDKNRVGEQHQQQQYNKPDQHQGQYGQDQQQHKEGGGFMDKVKDKIPGVGGAGGAGHENKGGEKKKKKEQKAKYLGETSVGTRVTQGRRCGTTGSGGGRGARGGGRSGTSARGGGTSGRSGTSALRGKAKASKRFKQVGEAWISRQQSTTNKAYGPLSKLHPTGPLMRNGIVVSTKSFMSSQTSTEPGK